MVVEGQGNEDGGRVRASEREEEREGACGRRTERERYASEGCGRRGTAGERARETERRVCVGRRGEGAKRG